MEVRHGQEEAREGTADEDRTRRGGMQQATPERRHDMTSRADPANSPADDAVASGQIGSTSHLSASAHGSPHTSVGVSAPDRGVSSDYRVALIDLVTAVDVALRRCGGADPALSEAWEKAREALEGGRG